MELITLKEASRTTTLSYTYLYENKSKLGFFQPLGKGKWLVEKKILEEKLKDGNNFARLTSKEVKCQSKNVVTCGTLTSKRQTDQELEDLLAREIKRKHRNITIG